MAANTSSDQPRVSFCCEPGLYLRGWGCYAGDTIPAGKIILPEIHRSNLSVSDMRPEQFLPRYGGIHCFVKAEYNLHNDLAKNVLIYLLENGTIHVNDLINVDKSFDIDKYCLASRMTDNGTMSVASVCLQVHHSSDLRNLIINIILPSISIPFFVATLIIYTILPEVRNVQRHVFRSYIAALCISFIAYVEIGIDRLCNYAIMLTLQFSVLATFFWLNVMSFDIWWTFRGMVSRQHSTSQSNRKKIIIYNCYAWGIPTLISGTGAILDLLHVESPSVIRPGFSENCTYTSDAAILIYTTAPVACAIFSNIFFFASTMIKIFRQKKATAQDLAGTDSQRHDDKAGESFNLYLKLFIVMGISRLGSFLAWVCEGLPDYIWYILAAEGALQGPLIFVVYIWKENTKRLLLNHLARLTKIFRCVNSSNTA